MPCRYACLVDCSSVVLTMLHLSMASSVYAWTVACISGDVVPVVPGSCRMPFSAAALSCGSICRQARSDTCKKAARISSGSLPVFLAIICTLSSVRAPISESFLISQYLVRSQPVTVKCRAMLIRSSSTVRSYMACTGSDIFTMSAGVMAICYTLTKSRRWGTSSRGARRIYSQPKARRLFSLLLCAVVVHHIELRHGDVALALYALQLSQRVLLCQVYAILRISQKRVL